MIHSLVVCITHSLCITFIIVLRRGNNKAHWFLSVILLKFDSNFLAICIIVKVFGDFDLLLLWEHQRVFISFINFSQIRFGWLSPVISLVCFRINFDLDMLLNQIGD